MSQPRITRSHTCGELGAAHLNQEVTLCGWIAKRRDLGQLVFADLRDRYGITQIVVDPAVPGAAAALESAHRLRSEFVVAVRGKVRGRPEGMANSKMSTGAIEVICTEIQILSEAKTPPFAIEDDSDAAETLRLKYRYLDLRRPSLQRNLMIRHRMLQIVRNHLDRHGFIEIETPILYKSTPEGARDFIVPSRVHGGEFYALPQSPQTLKQLLMVSGMDRYYQIARCFRDEDLRADRQPEFTQIDIETSFLDEKSFFPILEAMVKTLWKEVLGQEVVTPFPQMAYSEAMERYGSDKPDVRFGLELQDLSQVFAASTFQVFSRALEPRAGIQGGPERRGSIRAIVVPGQADKFSRKDIDDLQAHCAQYGAKGLLWMKVQAGAGGGTEAQSPAALELNSPAAKFFTDAEKTALHDRLKLNVGDLVLVVADPSNKVVFDSLGALRLKLGEKLGLQPKAGEGKPAFLWVTRFPLVEWDEKEQRFYACHHPFTSPRPEFFEDFIAGRNLERMEASAYDMVLNGVEVGGGSLRIYRPEVQAAMFGILGLTPDEAKEKFGFFLEALQYGTPPHGGIAFGVERLAAMLCGVGPIRDVMAFPKTASGTCLMSESPSRVTPEQLAELSIAVAKPQAKAPG